MPQPAPPVDAVPADPPLAQNKVCSRCLNPLASDAPHLVASGPTAIAFHVVDADAGGPVVCVSCAECTVTALPRTAPPPEDLAEWERERDEIRRRRTQAQGGPDGPPDVRIAGRTEHAAATAETAPGAPFAPAAAAAVQTRAAAHAALPTASTSRAHPHPGRAAAATAVAAAASAMGRTASTSRARGYGASLDPLMDITRLRVRSRGYHCLYPGATFQGLQESGKNSYDVTVTIVDVDVGASFLCGYLCIRGLTEDWPEMTTYFDAQIIGSRYGFLTEDWGATEKEDMMHWGRFPAFRQVRHELRRPGLTMPDMDRGAVFMRWKERFLVPDHRVQDINGASFAGFYYVCVDFNPQPASTSGRVSAPRMSPTSSTESDGPSLIKPERSRRESSGSEMHRRSPSFSGARGGLGAATMSGFYYHQNSEPYQQLSLYHVPESHNSGFEFR